MIIYDNKTYYYSFYILPLIVKHYESRLTITIRAVSMLTKQKTRFKLLKNNYNSHW